MQKFLDNASFGDILELRNGTKAVYIYKNMGIHFIIFENDPTHQHPYSGSGKYSATEGDNPLDVINIKKRD